MTLYFTINSPHQWVLTSTKGVESSGVVDELTELPASGERFIAVVPGEHVVSRVEMMPVRNRAKLMSAIPYAIEDSVVSSVDDLHFVLLHTSADNDASFVYVSRKLMADWLQEIDQAGITIDTMLPDYFLLPGAAKNKIILTRSSGNRVLMRSGLNAGTATSEENLAALLKSMQEYLLKDSSLHIDDALFSALPVQPEKISQNTVQLKVGHTLLDWLTAEQPEAGPGLLNDEFSQGIKQSILKQYWPAVAMVLLAIFIKLGSDVGELLWLQKSNAQLQQSTESLYQELFPGSKLLSGKVRTQTKNNIAGLQNKSAGNNFSYLIVTTAALLKNQKVIYEELDYKQGQLLTVLTLNDFAHLDRVRKQLQADKTLEVSLKQSGARGSKVQARFVISRATS